MLSIECISIRGRGSNVRANDACLSTCEMFCVLRVSVSKNGPHHRVRWPKYNGFDPRAPHVVRILMGILAKIL